MDELEKVNETLVKDETGPESSSETELEAESEAAETVTLKADADDDEMIDMSSEEQADEESSDESSDEESSDESDVSSPVVTQVILTKSKKQFILERTIIIAGCIFLAALLVFGVSVLAKNIMTPTVEGVWACSKAYIKGDEANAQKLKTSGKDAVYFVFEPDGDYSQVSGTVTLNGKWTYADSKGNAVDQKTEYVKIYAEGHEKEGTTYKVDLEGNNFSEKTLKLILESDYMTQVYEFSSCEGDTAPEYKMELDKNFKPVNDILGKWYDKNTKITISFNKDGSYDYLDETNHMSYKGNYTVNSKKKTINLKFVTQGQDAQSGDMAYSLSKGKLTYLGITFTKAK